MPRILILAVLGVLTCFYFSMDYGRICAFLQTGLPPRMAGAVARFRTGAWRVLRRYLRAYGLLWLLTFGEVLVGLLILRRPYAFLVAFGVATVDLLPIVGAGSVLIPWAGSLFLLGKPAIAAGLMILYGVVTVVRQIAEPYLVGGSLGIPPVVTLLCMALGLVLFGFWGVLLGPVAALVIQALWFRDRRWGNAQNEGSPDRR
jgi:sporulation integral membrane protein YtvI